MKTMTYKGFTIQKYNDPWAKKFGWNYLYCEGDVMDDGQQTASTLKEAKEEIDEIISSRKS